MTTEREDELFPQMAEATQMAEDLDAYLRQVQSGEPADRQALLRAYPELRSTLDYLQALHDLSGVTKPYLEGLAAPANALGSARGLENAETHLPRADSAAQRPTLPAQRDFGDYELLAELGRGGMGVVFKARQKRLDRLVAVKMLHSSRFASNDEVLRMQQEARLAGQLKHPGIVRVIDAGVHEGQHYFAMEYVDGRGLDSILREGPLPQNRAIRILMSIAEAVDYLHQHGVVHRDLKPSNVLIDEQDHVCVTDFGLAKHLTESSDLTGTGMIAGTPCYMAPEQASGKSRQVGPGADIYSLGAIMYEMLTGQPPFREVNPLDTLLKVIESEPTPPRQVKPGISKDLERICLRCLEKKPDDRYASAKSLANDLHRALVDEEISLPAQGWVKRIWRWVHREPSLVLRWSGALSFYAMELVNRYRLQVVEDSFHWRVTGIAAIWAVLAWMLARLQRNRAWQMTAAYLWGAMDMGMYFTVLMIADGVASPLVIGLPLIVMASGLWFRTRLVIYVTALSLCSYLALMLDYYVWRPARYPPIDMRIDRHIFFLLALTICGITTLYMVYRVRRIARLFETYQ